MNSLTHGLPLILFFVHVQLSLYTSVVVKIKYIVGMDLLIRIRQTKQVGYFFQIFAFSMNNSVYYLWGIVYFIIIVQ